jgi:hypothetical protein
LAQDKWVVDGELVMRNLGQDCKLEIQLLDSGLEIKVWENPKDKYKKRKILYHKIISHGQLGYYIPKVEI